MKILTSNNKRAFTLIELMVVITIIVIVSLATYLPYAHHQKKVLIKQGAKELVQSLTEARNLAINGINSGSGNLSVGLYFGADATQIDYYTVGFTGSLNIASLPTNPYKVKRLPQGVQIDSITGIDEETLITFDAITGSGTISSTNSSYTMNDIVDILVSYKGATTPVLQKKIEYYTQSYISDY
ncbi:prepilin-type N-terminal cleavage/methylation domain-containing protein [Candidatus Gracilibacteria bacterium]|nr:prepilin-type N-terminal cleavage/methylation domain-containing protein [Candidatus Gracilibacteria bacterium]